MKPVRFIGANLNLAKPANMTNDQCSSLPVRDDGTVFASEWVPSQEELAILKAGGRVHLSVWTRSHPPVKLEVVGP